MCCLSLTRGTFFNSNSSKLIHTPNLFSSHSYALVHRAASEKSTLDPRSPQLDTIVKDL